MFKKVEDHCLLGAYTLAQVLRTGRRPLFHVLKEGFPSQLPGLCVKMQVLLRRNGVWNSGFISRSQVMLMLAGLKTI